MFSARESTIPIVTFVGRPLDPNKGLITFLDALELLLGLKTCPRFATWIVGGDDDELVRIHDFVQARSALHAEAREGRLTILGKVSRHALPDFYRRSHVVVMPSLREPFGLVAIEAMACGTPVIGTRQGGLDDTVLSGLTGAKVEIDQPCAFAAAILLYLRSSALRVVRGRLAREWAVASFSKADAYGRMARLYDTAALPEMREPIWDLPARFHAAEIERRIPAVEALIERRVSRWHVVAARYHVVAKLETTDGDFAMKVYRDRPSLASAMLPIGADIPARVALDFVDNAIFHAKNPCVARLVATDRNLGIAIYEWIEAMSSRPTAEQFRFITGTFVAHGSGSDIGHPKLDSFRGPLDEFLATKSEAALHSVDLAAAELNRVRQGTNLGNRLLHPCVELHRIVMCLDQMEWPIPLDIANRMRMVMKLLLAKQSRSIEDPRLQHGDLKTRHIVFQQGRPIVFDTEHSVFAVGELDLAAYASGEVYSGVRILNALRTLAETVDAQDRGLSAVQWLAYFLVHGYLARVHHGKASEPEDIIRRALSDLAIALV